MNTKSFLAGLGFALAAAVPCAQAQAVTLTGKVVDNAGKPLEGAVVKLLAARLADTTGADGRFDFTGKAIGIAAPGKTLHRESIRSEGNRFLLEAGSDAIVEVTLHDLRGARVARVYRGTVHAGVNVFPFDMAKLAARPLWIRIRRGDAVSSYPMGSIGRAGGREAAQPAEAGRITEQQRTAGAGKVSAAAGDWLQAYKPGYAPSAQAITSYAGDYPITLGPLTDPDFGPNVVVFDPAMPMASMQARIDGIHAAQAAQFGTERWALLFKPGAYSLNVDVDYYVQALGLGSVPDDVAITGSVRSMATTANNNVTIEFWRACENLSVIPTASGAVDTWAVSQGASFRRMHVKGSLALSMGGWASGGFIADSKIDNQVVSGSQQQWYSRNAEMGSWSGGVWNMAFTGVVNAPATAWPGKPFTVIALTPKVREKPFLFVDKAGKFCVLAPVVRTDASGTSWAKGPSAGEVLSIDLFHIAHPESDDAASLNAALAAGKHLILTPGIYHLSEALRITRPGTVVLGLGMATLVPDNGNSAVTVADVDGVKLAGLLIDAGPVESPVLLQVGNPAAAGQDHSADPTAINDVHIRVGGGRPGSAISAVVIHSNDVIGDHLWIWRADHGAGVGWTFNTARNGLVVNGDRVTWYGLFVEHFQEYQTLWNGDGGRVHFYQSELPYDPPTQADWTHDGVNGYASYKVADNVKTHEAWGLGVYCAFRAGPIQDDHAIEAPAAAGVQIRHAVSIWLNGIDGSGIGNVLNATGGAVTKTKTKATID